MVDCNIACERALSPIVAATKEGSPAWWLQRRERGSNKGERWCVDNGGGKGKHRRGEEIRGDERLYFREVQALGRL